MRRRLFTAFLASLAVTVAVPLWAAFTFDGAMHRVGFPETTLSMARDASRLPLSEVGTLALTGSLLLGLASAVRHAA